MKTQNQLIVSLNSLISILWIISLSLLISLFVSCSSDFVEAIESNGAKQSIARHQLNPEGVQWAIQNVNSLEELFEIDFGGARIGQIEFFNAVTPEDITNQTGHVDQSRIFINPALSQNLARNGFRFVPRDPRRDGRENITYGTVPFNVDNGIDYDFVFDIAFDIWEQTTDCNNVVVDKVPLNFAEVGLPSRFLGIGGPPRGAQTDINVLGFVQSRLFPVIGSDPERTLGVALTLAFFDENGQPTDINNDGKIDTNSVEIWFNAGFNWVIETPVSLEELRNGTADIAHVAVHEIGHAFGLGHTGTLLLEQFDNGDDPQLFFTPKNVMNAAYIGQTNSQLQGDDNAIYCEQFSAWPNW